MLRIIKIILCGLYNVWFYILAGSGLLILLPVFFVLTYKETWYPQFFWVARNIWANIILFGMGLIPKIEYKEPFIKGNSYMLAANHKSMIDVMLMLRVSKIPFVFVGKKELVKLPIFGYFYKRVAIMVDRDSRESRKNVYKLAQRRLDQGLGICIFPEGAVFGPEVKLAPFKNGVFRFSTDFQMPIVPMSFLDCEKRYPYHFSYNHFVGGPGFLRVRVHNHISTKGLGENDRESLKKQVYDLLWNDLND
jgi:1-acyl-sn-glycerol-3-phosphate acyltransferase